MDEMEQGAAVADSPPADASAGTTTAGSQNTSNGQPTVEKEPPFHQHPRFQQLIGENRTLKSTVAEMQRSIGEMQRLQQQAQSGAGLSQDEQKQYSEAAQALKKILAADPELKEMFESRSKISKLEQGYQGVQRLSQAHQQSVARAGRAQIEQMVKDADLPSDKTAMEHIEALVANRIGTNPELLARFNDGDLSAISEAFDAVKGFLGSLRRDSAATVLTAKTKTRQLPPAPRGGAAGAEAPPKLVEGKEREYERGIHQRGAALLARLRGE